MIHRISSMNEECYNSGDAPVDCCKMAAGRRRRIELYSQRRSLWWNLFLTYLLVLLFPGGTYAGSTIIANFTDGSTLFNHLTITDTDSIFIGAVNNIYQLDSSLSRLKKVTTGPKLDSPLCRPNTNPTCLLGGTQRITKSSMNNFNQVLLVDTPNQHLITCGSVYQGTCEIRPLGDVSQTTKEYREEKHYVASNNASKSTVAFIGKGLQQYPSDADMGNNLPKTFMFVATSFSGSKQIRDHIPAVTSRFVDGNSSLSVVYKHSYKEQGTLRKIAPQYLESYPIHYVSGFEAGGFSYFTSVHKEPESSQYLSKIVQICQNDPYYYSFTEMPLQCLDGSKNYNLLQATYLGLPGASLRAAMGMAINEQALFAVFNSTSSSDSALCVYKISDIRKMFTSNIRKCFNGTASPRAKYYVGGGSQPCTKLLYTVPEDYCGLFDKNSPIVGDIPLTASPVSSFTDLSLSAITVATTGDYTVAFLGTETGHLKKVLISSSRLGNEYSEMLLMPNSSINRDLLLDQRQNHIYVMGRHKVSKVAVEDCQSLKTCSSCLASKDPYCGWCSLENKCSVKTRCGNAGSSRRWISSQQASSQCISISSISPRRLAKPNVGKVKVELTVNNLPSNEDYICIFDEDSFNNRATPTATGLKCDIPTYFTTDFPSGKDFKEVSVFVKAGSTGVKFLQSKMFIYDCAVHTSCTQCTNSSWACDWCIYDNKCTHNSNSCQLKVVTGKNNPTDAIQKGPGFCPRLERLRNSILVPNSVPKIISLKGMYLPEPLSGQRGYECIVEIEGNTPQRVSAKRISEGLVTCNSEQYTYTATKANRKARIKVVFNNDHYIDDYYGFFVTVYKCDVHATDCSSCHSLSDTRPELQCVWCDSRCNFNTTCKSPPEIRCPQPVIKSVSPMTGPIQGGTNLTIIGLNLGKTFNDVTVTVSGVPCKLIKDSYIISIQIVCTIGSVRGEEQGAIVVTLADGGRDDFEYKFLYQDPSITSFSPSLGPMAGGSLVEIKGTKLTTGNVLYVMIGDIPCKLQNDLSGERITCMTKSTSAPSSSLPLRVFFDGAVRNSGTFTYTKNPTITSIAPMTSFSAGGLILTITGTHFTSIKSPKMFIRDGNLTSKPTTCTVLDETKMECPSPVAPQSQRRRRRRKRSDQVVQAGFIMDNVQAVKNMTENFPGVASTITYVANPEYLKFTEPNQLKILKGENLIIEGRYLNLASSEKDVTVSIGAEKCEVKSLAVTRLICEPPIRQPASLYAPRDPKSYPLVKVKVGNLEFELGKLKYEEPQPLLPLAAILGMAVGGGVLLLIIIGVLIAYKRRASKAERDYKKMQIQLDTLESNVRNECKQAFAELQTDMTDLTSDLNVTGIPYWDYESYILKVLFPAQNDYRSLIRPTAVVESEDESEIGVNPSYSTVDSSPPNKTYGKLWKTRSTRIPNMEQAMLYFNTLVVNKEFLITFINTLEAQKSFTIRDKVTVASLVMIVLQDKMEYATEILTTLLEDLIEKSVEKKHPKLMLRRTESVVEKMLTNWMSICLYGYLKDYAGSSLFMLCKAIKHQIDKGPVDAVTSEARYSLSEDKLLREKIHPTMLTINVLQENGETVQCKVLDCDTITQVKEKMLDVIFKNSPYTTRPSVYEVELEWRHGMSGQLTLKDEDISSEVIGSCKRINTLAHYNVSEGAYMTLVTNRSEMVKAMNGNLEPVFLPRSYSLMDYETGPKVWHLVKPQQDDNYHKDRGQKVISEIFLTRLLATKGTLQKFVDDLFGTILSVNSNLPPAVKYLFDFLDAQALRHNLTDPEVVHTWKSNSLPLRFWVNIIKNPDFVFDIHKSHIVDSCLSVIAQTFMDSCSRSDHRLGKDSPSNKLLFAKDIPKYKKLVETYYSQIQSQPTISEEDMYTQMNALSAAQTSQNINPTAALRELYKFAVRYTQELMEAFEDNPRTRKQQLSHKLLQVSTYLETEMETSVENFDNSALLY